MGTYSLTGFAIISVLCSLSSIILWNTSSILVRLGQPLAVAQYSGVFARYLIPGIPFSFVYELIRKVSQSRNEAMPMLFSSVICNVVTTSVGYYLVHWTTWGWLGAAIARSAGEVILVPSILMAMIMGWGEEEGNSSGTKNVDERTVLMSSDSNLDSVDENDREFLQQLMDGLVVSDALHPSAVIEFLTLGLPGMLQLMFEW
jgi:Na+-driven multidrug efflux pump